MVANSTSAREQAVKQMIVDALRGFSRDLSGYRMFLFGSRAAGTHHSRSDFDIGVLGEQPLPLRTFYAIEDALDELPTLYRIDWVDLNRAGAAFRERVMQQSESLPV